MDVHKIRVFIADDGVQTRENIKKILSLEDNIEIVGESADGQETVRTVLEIRPDVVLMDVNMPVMNGIQATEIITLERPETVVVIMSAEGDQEYLRKAMIAGARDFLVKPFSSDAMVTAINRVFNREKHKMAQESAPPKAGKKSKVISVYSPHDGVGKSTIAANLAACLAVEYRQRTAIVDLNLQFGDLDLILNIVPDKSIADLIARYKDLDSDMMEQYLSEHPCGLKLLAAPPKPQYAETVTVYCVEKVLETLREQFSVTIVDTSSVLQDSTLAALDASDQILLITALDLPSLRNTKLCLEVMDALHYPDDKIKIVMNRASGDMGISLRQVEETLSRKIAIAIPSDGRTVVPSVNNGNPFVLQGKNSKVAESIREMANMLLGVKGGLTDNMSGSLLKRLRITAGRRAG